MTMKLSSVFQPVKNSTLKRVIAGFTCLALTTTTFAQTTFLSQLQTNGNASDTTQQQAINAARAGGAIPGGQLQAPQNYVQPKPLKLNELPKPSEFEIYVSAMTGEQLTRFGSDLVKDGEHSYSPSSTAALPNDYIIAAGDELYVRVWGSVDADLRLVVDRQGQVVIPKVGAVQVAGVPYGNLSKTIQNAIGKTYSGANVAASVGQMRGIRVYVTGYAQTPGAYTCLLYTSPSPRD